MTAPLAFLIIGLALIDSTSLGTSLIPLWLLLTPGRLSKARIGSYLLTLTLAYFAMGLAVAAGAASLFNAFQSWISSAPDALLVGGQTTIGALIITFGLTLLIRNVRGSAQDSGNALFRWRNQAMTAGSSRGLVRLALLAFGIEFATMVPYVGAIVAMTDAEMSWESIILWVFIYCAVMMAPAGILTVFRLALGHRIDPLLRRLDAWLERHMRTVSGSGLTLLGALIVGIAITNLVS
ncbi:GAP family protein [Auritidibacter ignavus]|uniref:GAP family protein n=1 Tax=Auritidibacter ignavus TaxID=678932 RepID=A0AAJ6AHV8_9MICC|nr:GAP family protein [Auritidibacter ignavus]WGH92584.1 GAP family protein [Auritidibacter ignavus]WHS29037.1 GAP family protein [Auritidibacter ignavus]WHS35935.1 GAP family protein [Auritidibacter ignavus]